MTWINIIASLIIVNKILVIIGNYRRDKYFESGKKILPSKKLYMKKGIYCKGGEFHYGYYRGTDKEISEANKNLLDSN